MREVSDYSLLACAIAGRRVAVHLARGHLVSAYSDGQSVFLPEAMENDPHAWFTVVAQASLIAGDSLRPAELRKLVGRSDVARRYTCFEALRLATQLADRLPTAYLKAFAAFDAGMRPVSRAESLHWALGNRPVAAIEGELGTVRPISALHKLVSDEGFMAATESQAKGEFNKKELKEFDDDEDTEESKLLKLFQNPFASSNNPLADMLNDILGAGSSKGSQEAGGGGDEIPVGRFEQALRRGVKAVVAKLPFDFVEVEPQSEGTALRYPEWDEYKKIYRKDWAVVEEVEAWRPESDRELSEFIPAYSREMQRQLSMLGLDHEMHRRQQEGADLDEGRLVDMAIELSSGFSPTSLDVYRASRKTRRDLAVAIALDISGSTAESDREGKSVFDRQLAVAYQLSRALSQLGDKVALFGFHSWGRNLVRSVRLKGHEEPWSGRVAERMSRLEPYGYTRTGTAIRHGTRMLFEDMRLPNRLFVLITDGIAYDQDYELSYAEADSRKALLEAMSKGTACVCICIGGSANSAKLESVFGEANLLVVEEPAQVVPRIRLMCSRALARAGKGSGKKRRESA